MIDSTGVWAILKRLALKGCIRRLLVAITPQGLTTKIHPRAGRSETPSWLILPGAQRPITRRFQTQWLSREKPRLLLADKGYDNNRVRKKLLIHEIKPVIPPRVNQKDPQACDFKAYNKKNTRRTPLQQPRASPAKPRRSFA